MSRHMVPDTIAAMTVHTSHPPRLSPHPDGITAVDTEYLRPGMAAAHIIRQGAAAAFVDVGTNYSVPHLLAALSELGIPRDAVEYVFITHVHLDHAGGAGLLMQSLPKARLVAHPRGAPHLVDPSKLIKASIAVYGQENYRSLYGELVPVPADRMEIAADGQVISLQGREFTLLHTPGHAMHHYSLVDGAHHNIFTGDTFGLSYRELDSAAGAFIVPTTTPTQFDPEQLVASIDRLMATQPHAAYLMHYSRVTDLPRLATALKQQIRDFATLAQRHAVDPDPYAQIRADMRALWLRLMRQHGVEDAEARIEPVLGNDLDLNTQGLVSWLERLNSKRS
jgi:glyoxylase-like metal-dependent hydrolase (beta-lactamase superfamily II)